MDITVTGKSGSAIQRAIDKAAAAGGGRISLKPGTYPCATIWLRSNIELHIPAGAKLLGSANPEDYEDFDDPRLPVAPQKNLDEYGLKFTILASPTLSPWITIDEYPFDPATGLCIPDIGIPPPPKMFFRWRLTIGDAD